LPCRPFSLWKVEQQKGNSLLWKIARRKTLGSFHKKHNLLEFIEDEDAMPTWGNAIPTWGNDMPNDTHLEQHLIAWSNPRTKPKHAKRKRGTRVGDENVL
jgi:hypothetical protein